MTNKEELRARFEDKFSIMLSRAERESGESAETWVDSVIDFFWNEIEKIRKEDMDRMVEDINKINPVIFSFIKQDNIVNTCTSQADINYNKNHD